MPKCYQCGARYALNRTCDCKEPGELESEPERRAGADSMQRVGSLPKCEWHLTNDEPGCGKAAKYVMTADWWRKPVPVCHEHKTVAEDHGFQTRRQATDLISCGANKEK